MCGCAALCLGLPSNWNGLPGDCAAPDCSHVLPQATIPSGHQTHIHPAHSHDHNHTLLRCVQLQIHAESGLPAPWQWHITQCEWTLADSLFFFSSLQHYALDFQAIGLAFVATVLPPIAHMSHQKPPSQVGIRRTFILTTVMTLIWAGFDILSFRFLMTRDFGPVGNGTSFDVSSNVEEKHILLFWLALCTETELMHACKVPGQFGYACPHCQAAVRDCLQLKTMTVCTTSAAVVSLDS